MYFNACGKLHSMPFDFTRDGHVHSGFCPHGSGEPTRLYLDKAVELGFRRVSIVEHYPLPPGFPPPPTSFPIDMRPDEVDPYIEETLALRDEYSDRIDVLFGFEWDYLPGYENWTREQMDIVGPRTLDGLLSVHFLDKTIIDETAEIFLSHVISSNIKTLDNAYRLYYKTVLDSVRADLGAFKPRRISHLNLIRRFQMNVPAPGEFREEIIAIVNEVASRDMQLDLNMSGIRRPLCGEPYVPVWLIEMITLGKIDVMCIFGSDAHSADSVGSGLGEALEIVRSVVPAPESV